MKVVHISTGYNHGGAAIACKRLVVAQRENGIDATILTQERGDFPDHVTSVTRTLLAEKLNFFRLAWEKFVYLFYQSSGTLRFQYSIANMGIDVSKRTEVKNADIIHLHWINAGFISIKGLKKLINLNKPVVWTLHDIWPLTGGCHITGQCKQFKNNCFNCFYLRKESMSLSVKLQQKKMAVYNNSINFVSPSRWQEKRAKSSLVFGSNKMVRIPNSINRINSAFTKLECRRRLGLIEQSKIILFGAFNTQDRHKGMKYLIRALEKMPSNDEIVLVIFGKRSHLFDNVPFRVHSIGYVSNEIEMIQAYNAADLFVTPSIEDNLPNTILESFSVGTPVVAFNIGGIPDIIDHKKNGYLARSKDINDFAKGMLWCLDPKNNSFLSANAIQKIDSIFSPEKVAKQFYDYYQSILNADDAKN